MNDIEKNLSPDICVIGGGSGGLSVAAAVAAFGVDVVLIENNKMGGDCLNYGCVPSKALIAASKHAHSAMTSEKFGVNIENIEINWQMVHSHVKKVIETIAPMDSVERFEGLGVKVLQATASFVDKNTISAGEYTIKARRIVIATGSHPFVPPIRGIENVPYYTNETIFERTQAAKHLIIIGGGPIGIEMAQAHKRLGVAVTIIEGLQLLGKEDRELAHVVIEKIKDEGINIFEQTSVVAVDKSKDMIAVTIKDEFGSTSTIEGDVLLVATGRKANIEKLGLDKANIATSKTGIKVDSTMRTTNKRVYAIGDVAGGLQFTHAAGYHAGLVVRALLFRLKAVENRNIVPWVTYTDPEIAHVGYTEKMAAETFGAKNIKTLRWSYKENDRAQAELKTDGLIKITTKKNGKILGASIVGVSAGEMIHIWALAITKNMKVGDIAAYVPPYPTLSEIGKRAATSFYLPATKNKFVRAVIKFLQFFG